MTFEFEFFGPVGTAVCTVTLPGVLYSLATFSTPNGCLSILPLTLPDADDSAVLFSWQGIAAVYAWMLALLALHVLLPAKSKQGVMEPTGTKWTYRLNGLLVLSIVYLGVFVLAFFTPYLPLYWLADHFLELLTGALTFSASMSVALYAFSFRKGAVLASAGTSGQPSYDFWMGRELNPRFGKVDLKEFCELYPGLTGWVMLNLAFAHKQFVTSGEVSAAMALLNLFQLGYVVDSVWNEASILTTMDITSEGFGYMLVFGDLCWVPFAYCTQAKYLFEQATALPLPLLAAATALNVVGYAIFRGANSQKDTFRRDPGAPSVAHLKQLQTKRGTKLLYSGWWGVARHINYTGDWLMGLAWCMLCGTSCVIPYFYAAYFAVLLLHRERRDDHSCRLKYGRDWDTYCSLVPYRLIPFVY